MAVKLADAVAYIKTDDKELRSGIADAETQVSGMGGRFGSILTGIGVSVGMGIANIAAQAVGQVVQFMGDSVAAASDLGETLSKTNVLFGESADAVVAFAESAAVQFGQSRQQALDAAATFATFGSAAGLAGEDLVNFSTGFVGLASDLASFNNTTPEQAIEAIGAALRGESEPLRQYGVLLDDATLRQKALELGIYDGEGALTAQQKVLAAQAAIYEQTGAAQGDFERTSGGLANQQRILDAQMADLQATIGEALLPVVLAFTSALNSLVQTVLPPLQEFMQSRIIPVMQAFGDLISATLGPAIAALQGWFQGLGQTMQTQADGPMAYLKNWFEENMPRIQAVVQRVLDAMTTFWNEFGDEIMFVVNTALSWIVQFWDTQMRTILDIVTVILQVLTGDFEGAGRTLEGIVSRWWEFFQSAFEAIRRTITSIDWGNVGRAVVDGIWDGMRSAWGGMQDWFSDQLQGMRDMLPFSEPRDPASPLRGLTRSGEAIVGMIQEGINSAAAWTLPALAGPEVAGAGAGTAPISITINIGGAQDANSVGLASRDGVLSALRAAGLR